MTKCVVNSHKINEYNNNKIIKTLQIKIIKYSLIVTKHKTRVSKISKYY